MDPIEVLINSKQKFDLNLLVNALYRLSVIQLEKGSVTHEEASNSFKCQILGPRQYTAVEIEAHCGLIFESIISPSISGGQVLLKVTKEAIGNEEKFVQLILEALQKRYKSGDMAAFDEFEKEAQAYIARVKDIKSGIVTIAPPPAVPAVSIIPKVQEPAQYENVGGIAANFMSKSASKPYMVPSAALQAQIPIQLPPPPHLQQQQQSQASASSAPIRAIPGVVEYDGPAEFKYAPARVEFERAEPIVRLLAQVRKVGMDILFPQSTHDKILAIIFVAVKFFATPAHRELIDMVMAVKEAGHVKQLEPVSKTKIRGVLALLKHGELLITQGEYGEPVRLFLAPGIETFKDLRERHDAFLSSYMIDHHLFIPAVLRTELVWQVDEETKKMRLGGMEALVLRLKQFFGGMPEYSVKALDGEANAEGASKVPSPPSAYAARGMGGRGGAARGPPYGGPGSKFGQQYPQYAGGRFGNNASPPESGYNTGYTRGGYTFASRAQHQRFANAQASLNWANNEEYAELAEEKPWTENSSPPLPAKNATSAGSTPSTGMSPSLSAQAPVYDATKLNPAAKSFGPPATVRPSDVASIEAFNFDVAPRFSAGKSAVDSSRLQGLSAGLSSLSAAPSDSTWLPQSGVAGKSKLDMWNGGGSSFFSSPPPGMDTALEEGEVSPLAPGNETLNLSLKELRVDAQPFPTPKSGLMDWSSGASALDMDLKFSREFDLLGGENDPVMFRTSPGDRAD